MIFLYVTVNFGVKHLVDNYTLGILSQSTVGHALKYQSGTYLTKCPMSLDLGRTCLK